MPEMLPDMEGDIVPDAPFATPSIEPTPTVGGPAAPPTRGPA